MLRRYFAGGLWLRGVTKPGVLKAFKIEFPVRLAHGSISVSICVGHLFTQPLVFFMQSLIQALFNQTLPIRQVCLMIHNDR